MRLDAVQQGAAVGLTLLDPIKDASWKLGSWKWRILVSPMRGECLIQPCDTEIDDQCAVTVTGEDADSKPFRLTRVVRYTAPAGPIFKVTDEPVATA